VERSARALKIGRLRPAIVLYDEPHPLGEDIGTLAAGDCGRKPGMLVVMGTSLKVHGLKALVRDFAKAVRAATPAAAKAKPAPRVVFVNRTPPPAEWAGVFDCWVQGETDAWCEQVEADWRRLRPQDWEIQQTLDGPGPSVGLKAQKSTTIPLPKKQEGKTLLSGIVSVLTSDFQRLHSGLHLASR
jgi:NAD-dependent histone deacetylase SIR2